MLTWILILSSHAGGQITMQPGGHFRDVVACTETGRAWTRKQTADGRWAGSYCEEVRR